MKEIVYLCNFVYFHLIECCTHRTLPTVQISCLRDDTETSVGVSSLENEELR